jgi:hypothetical protein
MTSDARLTVARALPTWRAPASRRILVKLRNLDLGGLLFGLIILGVGIYFLLDQTLGLDLPDLDWDKVWPLFLIALGVGIVFSTWTKGRAGDGPGA